VDRIRQSPKKLSPRHAGDGPAISSGQNPKRGKRPLHRVRNLTRDLFSAETLKPDLGGLEALLVSFDHKISPGLYAARHLMNFRVGKRETGIHSRCEEEEVFRKQKIDPCSWQEETAGGESKEHAVAKPKIVFQEDQSLPFTLGGRNAQRRKGTSPAGLCSPFLGGKVRLSL